MDIMAEEATEAMEIEHHEMEAFAGVEPHLNIQQNSQGSFMSNMSVTSCVISHTRFARSLVYVFLVITCAPLVAGFAFTSIFVEDGNYHAAVPAFFAGCISVGSLSLFVMHLLRKLERYHDSGTLEGLKIFGMLTSVASGISLGVYTILAFFDKQSFNLHGVNYYSTAVFCGLCLFSSIELYIVSQWYQNALQVMARAAGTINIYTLPSRSTVP